MLRLGLLLFLLFFFKAANSQLPIYQWANQFGSSVISDIYNDNGRSVAVDLQGNVYSVGIFFNQVDFDPGPGVYNLIAQGQYNQNIYISKLNAFGQFVWAKQLELSLGGPAYMTLDKSGNIYITSQLVEFTDMDPGPGVFNVSPIGSKDAFILKLNSNGVFLWVRQFGGNGDALSFGSSIDIDINEDVIICGSFNKVVDFNPGSPIFNLSTIGNFESFITKLNQNGDFIWAKKLGNFNNIFASISIVNVKSDQSGNIYTTGSFQGDCDFDPSNNSFNLTSTSGGDAFITKIDINGNFIWAKKIGDINENTPVFSKGIDIDNENNVCISGTFYGQIVDFDPNNPIFNLSTNGSSDVFLLKLNAQGNFMWAKNFGGTNIDESYDLTIDSNSNLYTIGIFYGLCDFDPGPGSFLLDIQSSSTVLSKFDINGNFVYAVAFHRVFDGSATGRQVVTDNSQNIYVTGHFGGSIDFDPGLGVDILSEARGANDAFVLKLSRCENVTTFNINISTCHSYTLNNQTYNFSGIYTQIIPNSTDCDSIITLNLTINRKLTSVNASICEGQTYYAGGLNQTTSGIYKDTLLTSLGCDSIITTTLTVNPKPKPDLGPDGNLCTKTQASITPGIFKSYLWQDNSIQPNYTITSAGKYWVTVTDANNCSTTDTLNILSIDTIPKNFLPADQDLCYGNVLKITVPNYSSYQWSNGSTNEFIDISTFGTYYLTVKDFNSCTGTDSITIQRKNCIYIAIPNAFTPNGDTKNDIFKPTIFQQVKSFYFVVFNRYGQKLFETREYGQGWDGRLKGKAQPSGTYVYHIKYTNIFGVETVENGSVLLIR